MLFQKVLRKMGSQSNTMVLGNPCRRTIELMKDFATDLAVNGDGNGIKCVYFDKRSTL